jgi:RNA polymerase sigma-70 factor (ECF subfamily)
MRGGDPDGPIYRALCAGDAGAMQSLIHRYSPALPRFIHECLGSAQPEDVEEAFNDTMLAVWRDVAEYDPRRACFKTWVFFKARCVALDLRREMGCPARAAEPLSEIGAADISWRVILRVDLARALEQMGVLDRQIVYLCDYAGWDHQLVAKRLSLRRGALGTRLHRARKRLRALLAPWQPRQALEMSNG